MAPNYANRFLDKFENEMIYEFEQIHKVKPLVWYRYIDDIFFIWTDTDEMLKTFLEFAQNFSKMKNMKSNIQFEVNVSCTSVNFLDVVVTNEKGYLQTSLYSKPTDAHLYLNASSCHPSHVIKNIPKGLFIRIRRICSSKYDYLEHGRQLMSFLVKRGYCEKALTCTMYQVFEFSRDDLLKDKPKKAEDSQVIFITDRHPVFKQLPAILKKHYSVLQNDVKLKTVFQSPPKVAFRKAKNIRNFVVCNDTRNTNFSCSNSTIPCGKCKLCKNIMENSPFSGTNLRFSGGNCKSSNVIYGAWCKTCKLCYVGQTGDQLSDRFSKHRYDCKRRPENCELSDHFHKHQHDFEKELGVVILEQLPKNSTSQVRKHYEDRWICKLQTMQPNGINLDVGWYAKEMYTCYQRSF